MTRKNIVLVEPDKTTRRYMENVISKEGFDIISFTNGTDAFEYYLKNEVDVVITEMFMPGIDGMSLIRMMKDPARKQDKTIFIMISPITEGDMVKCAMEYADYYMVSPISAISLRYSLKYFTNNKTKRKKNLTIGINYEENILMVLKEIGIPASLNGYRYLIDALMILISTKDNINDIRVCKDVYPTIASKYGASSSRVERCIRNAIEVGFSRGNVKYLDELFGYTVETRKGKPTNTEFLFCVADYIKRGLKTS